ncbi:hypothetical protein c7_R323, partial [Megavirus courdo7]
MKVNSIKGDSGEKD